MRRRWRVIVLTIITAVVVTLVVTPADAKGRPKRYEATHVLILNAQQSTSVDGRRPAIDASNLPSVAATATGAEVAQRVATKLNFEGPPLQLAKQIEAEADDKTRTINVKSVQLQPERAELLANTFATELVTLLDEREAARRQRAIESLTNRAAALQTEIRKLEERIARTPIAAQAVLIAQRDALVRQYSAAYGELQLLAAEGQASSGIQTLEEARAGVEETSRFRAPETRSGRVLLAALLGTIFGAALALIVQRFDNRIGTKEGAEAAFGLPVLAEVPPISVRQKRKNQVLTAAEPSSLVAEAYRSLRTSLLLMHDDSQGNGEQSAIVPGQEKLMLLVSSANPAEGKTTTAVNLAAAFAEAGRSVLVIDCDFRHPRADKHLGVAAGPGLSDLLTAKPGTVTLDRVIRPSNVRGVRMVTAGRATHNPSELFHQASDVIATARNHADVVILDTAPILVINDALELIPIIDGLVLVSRAGRTSVESAQRASELLRRIGAPLRGLVLAGSTGAPASKGYYYYYYGGGTDGRGLRGLFTRKRRRPELEPDLALPKPPRPAKGGKNKKGGKGRPQPQQQRVQAQQSRPQQPPAASVGGGQQQAPKQQQPAPQQQAPKPQPAPQQQAPKQQPAPQPQAPKQQPAPQPPAAKVAPGAPPQPPPAQDDAAFRPDMPVPEPVDLGDPDDIQPDLAPEGAQPQAAVFRPSQQ